MKRACLLLAVAAVVAGDAGDCGECNTGDCSRCRRCVNTKSGACEACWADKKLGACLMVDRSLGDCRQCWDRGSRGATGRSGAPGVWCVGAHAWSYACYVRERLGRRVPRDWGAVC